MRVFLFIGMLCTVWSSYQIAIIGIDTQILNEISQCIKNISSSSTVNVFKDLPSLLLKKIDDTNLIVDTTTTQISHSAISSYASLSLIPLVVLGSGSNSNTTFYTDPSIECRISNIKSALAFFNASKIGLIWTYSDTKLALHHLLSQAVPNIISQNAFASISILEMASLLVKSFKIQGVQSYLLFGDKSLCSFYDSALQYSYLDTEGYLAIFLDECIYQVSSNGAIVLTNPLTVKATSHSDYIRLLLQPYLDIFRTNGLTNWKIF